MNIRPSRRLLAFAADAADRRATRSLRQRLVFIAGAAAIVLLGAITYGGLVMLRESMGGDEDARVINAASLSTQLVDRLLAERRRQVEMIATAPLVIRAARRGAEASRERGLTSLSTSQLDQMFERTRSLQVDSAALSYLRDLLAKLDIVEVMVTDQYGNNAVTTSRSSDFVQSDEAWWKTAWTDGLSAPQAAIDAEMQQTVVELAGVIRDGGRRAGVLKVKFGLSMVDSVLMQGSAGGSALHVDLVDSLGQVIASSVPSVRLRPFRAFRSIVGRPQNTVLEFSNEDGPRHGAMALANGGRWRLVAHMSEADATRGYRLARTSLLGGTGLMLVLIMGSLVAAGRFIHRRITGPAQQLAEVAEAVAAGDLSKRVNQIESDDEIGRLARAVSSMIDELRRLVGALNESAQETSNMTAEINASSEEMAASAGQIAHTAAELSQQAHVMAETIQALAGSSDQLVGVAADLDTGSREGVERNAHLRGLAKENRSRLDDSSHSLGVLSTDVEANAAAIDQLAQASEEVRSFVTLVQKLARQSKLLALNAAMEAARAGDHGHGFAVVAEEVRRLAAMSSDAAEKTERVVSGVLNGVSQSRASSERTVTTVRSVLGATEQASRSFGQIEQAVAEAETWTTSIQRAATATSGLSRDLRSQLDSLASGTESFAAAMQEVAASSEEQSASTEQIAAAAGTLSGAADRLGKLVANLRIDQGANRGGPEASPPHPDRSGRAGTTPVRLPPEVAFGD